MDAYRSLNGFRGLTHSSDNMTYFLNGLMKKVEVGIRLLTCQQTANSCPLGSTGGVGRGGQPTIRGSYDSLYSVSRRLDLRIALRGASLE